MCFIHSDLHVLRNVKINAVSCFQNQSPLYVAAAHSSSAELLKILVDAGAAVDAVNEVGKPGVYSS